MTKASKTATNAANDAKTKKQASQTAALSQAASLVQAFNFTSGKWEVSKTENELISQTSVILTAASSIRRGLLPSEVADAAASAATTVTTPSSFTTSFPLVFGAAAVTNTSGA